MRMKRTTLSRLAIFVVLYPWIVSYMPVDSLVTELGLSVATGREVRITRDCNDNIIRRDELPFGNVAASVSHQFDPEVSIGLAAGYASVRDDGDWVDLPRDPITDTAFFQDAGIYYIKPHLAFDMRYLGVSAGAVLSTPALTISNSAVRPTFALRVGSRKGFAWESSWMHNDLLVGPGWFFTGFAIAFPVGATKEQYARLFLGIGAGPSPAGLQMHAEIPIGDFTIDPGFVIEPEELSNGFFARLRYRLNAPPSP